MLVVTVIALAMGEPWLDTVVQLQSNPAAPLPSPDIRIDYLTGVFWAGVLGAAVFLWGTVVRFRAPLLIVWTIKAFVVLGPMLLYDATYGVDPDGYYHNASLPEFSWQGLELGQGTLNTQQITWIHFYWISSSFNASRLSFALIGLIAAYLTYRAGVIYTGRDDRRFFYAFALMPSILFWSSTLGKDPISLVGVAIYAYGVVAWNAFGKTRFLVCAALGILICVYIRIWLGPILLVPLTVLGVMRSKSLQKRIAFAALGLIGLIAAPSAYELTTGVSMLQADEFLGTTDMMSRSFETGGSTLEVPELTSFADLARFAPLGTFTLLFRPFVGEVPNLFGTLAGLENAFLLCLAFRVAWRTRLKDLKEPLVMWAIAAVLLWAFVYSVNSFQNLGTAARHRLHITPLFVGLLFYLGRRRNQLQSVDASRTVTNQRPLVAMRPGI